MYWLLIPLVLASDFPPSHLIGVQFDSFMHKRPIQEVVVDRTLLDTKKIRDEVHQLVISTATERNLQQVRDFLTTYLEKSLNDRDRIFRNLAST